MRDSGRPVSRRYSGSDDARTAAKWTARSSMPRAASAAAVRPARGRRPDDHRADVGQPLEDVEPAAGEVDGVDLDRRAGRRVARRDRRACAARVSCRSRRCRRRHAALRCRGGRRPRLQLAGRLVGDAEHESSSVVRQRAGRVRGRSGGERRAATAGAGGSEPGLDAARWSGDQALDVARVLGRRTMVPPSATAPRRGRRT